VQGRASVADEQYAEAVSSFHSALKSYKLRKTRNLTKSTKSGVATILNLFVSIRSANEKDYLERTRAELADPVYDGLEEELASVLQYLPWVAPLVDERRKVASAS
jgi:hypothetical protein